MVPERRKGKVSSQFIRQETRRVVRTLLRFETRNETKQIVETSDDSSEVHNFCAIILLSSASCCVFNFPCFCLCSCFETCEKRFRRYGGFVSSHFPGIGTVLFWVYVLSSFAHDP
jgi:hypothetical protein